MNTQVESTDTRADRFVKWVEEHRRALTIALVAAVVVGGGIWFSMAAGARKEAFASQALYRAWAAAEAGNFALAASDLSRLITTYEGTRAAQEAHLRLGQVRLLGGQTELVIADLKRFVESRPREYLRGPAHALLGAALEQAERFDEAGSAYEAAADAYQYEAVTAQLLVEAGRVWVEAGDTSRATAAYERVVRDLADQPSAAEARIRLAELTRTAGATPS